MTSANGVSGFSVRRLIDDSSLDQIKTYNDELVSRYPGHGDWVRRSLNSLAKDDYSRMAFGAYHSDGKGPPVLCGSVIVTAGPYLPHLKLKNLILMERHWPDTRDEEFGRRCIDTIIAGIKEFASNRGYSKLVTELFRDADEHRLIAQCCLRAGFSITGAQANRYQANDDVVYLTWDVHAVYGFDPFDYFAATHWIVNQVMPGAERVGEAFDLPMSVVMKEGRTVRMSLRGFRYAVGGDQLTETAARLRDRFAVVVIGDHIESDGAIEKIVTFNLDALKGNRLLIFSFFHEQKDWFDNLARRASNQLDRVDRFTRDDLLDLMYGSGGARNARASDLRLGDIGGLLTLSDPARFQFKKVQQLFNTGIRPIYIKLGPKGKSLPEEKWVVFCYFDPNSGADAPTIWAIGKAEEVISWNLTQVKSHDDMGAAIRLFHYLNEDLENCQPIWSIDDFVLHNKYNATNEVACMVLSEIIDLRDQRISFDSMNLDPARLKVLRSGMDNYLSAKETDVLMNIVHQRHPPRHLPLDDGFIHAVGAHPGDGILGYGQSIRVLCVHSYGSQEDQLTPDFKLASDELKNRHGFAEVASLPYAERSELLRALQAQPHVLHISAHGSSKEVALRSFGGHTVTVGAEWLRKTINAESPDTQLVLLLCCDSHDIARIVSRDGRVAIGFDTMLDSDFLQFIGWFYRQLGQSPSDQTVVRKVLALVAAHKDAVSAMHLSVWKDGVEVVETRA